MSSAVANRGKVNDARWRFWRDVLVFNLKMLLGNLRDFALIPVSLVAALIDVVSKGEREGSLFYRVLRWGAHSEEMLDAYSAVKDEKLTVNPHHTVDAVIARIESVMVREYEKGGTAASIKTALDHVIDQVQHGTGGHRERVQGAIAKASERLGGRLGLSDEGMTGKTGAEKAGAAIRIRRMVETDAKRVAALAGELGYPNEVEAIQQRIANISETDLLLVAVDLAEEVVGFIHAHRVCPIEIGFRVEILGLVVSTTARRQGVGRKLIAEVENWSKNAEGIVVRSNTKRAESHIFYPAMGYRAIKTQAVYEKKTTS
jgi:GNAT superfamily N-acetyltransferase